MMDDSILQGGCTGGSCSGGQCNGAGCNGGSCGGSGCSNNAADAEICKEKIVLTGDGYKGGMTKEILRSKLQEAIDLYHEYQCNRPTIDNVHYIDTKQPCTGSVDVIESNGLAYRCINGTWHYADGGRVTDKVMDYRVSKEQKPLYLEIGAGLNPCKEEPIYDHHGCIIGYKPFLVSEGEFGIWNTSEIYPMTKNCGEKDKTGDCEYVYRDIAGKNVRLFRTPSVSQQPFFIGGRDGVPNRYEPAGVEDDGAYVFMIGIRVEGITPPKNSPKPRCKVNPYTITYVERTEANKSVIGSGLLINTFIGDISGEKFAVPKIGLNSPDYYDVHINNGNRFFRGGEGDTTVPAYVFHSPDLHLRRPNLDAYRIIIEGEQHGIGNRHGIYDRGDTPENFRQDRRQQKGTRSSINLSNFTPYSEPVVQCVRAMSYVRADSKLTNDDKFTLPLLNTYKESCAYIEMNRGSGKVNLINHGSINPEPSGNVSFCDESFIGDTKNHERILKGAAQYATITRYIPNQYGSPILQTYIPIGLEIGSTNGIEDSGGYGLCGDSFVNGYGIKRTSYISDKVPDFIVSSPTDPDASGLKFLQWLMKALWKILGIKGFAELPKSGVEGQFTNRLHLGTRNGTANISGRDIYYPSLAKTHIWAYFNSDCNLHFRETGASELGEINIHRLKALNRDSSLPYGSKWEDGWLNRFYIPWNKASGLKQLILTVGLFLWCYVIGLWIILEGLHDLSLFVVGLSTSIFAAVWGVILLIVGTAWIILWATSSADNRILASFLGIDLQYPDIQWSENNLFPNASKFAMNEGRYRQFENMYHKINHDYSIPNSIEKGFGMGDPYITCACPCDKTNKILFSNKQDNGSYVDSWSNFQANNFIQVPPDVGKITKVFNLFGRLYAHTTDNIVELNLYSNTANVIFGGVVEGSMGLHDPNASEVTKWGYIFPDREAREWYIFTGGMPKAIGIGVRQFLNENMEFELLKQNPDFNLVDKKIDGGIGYSIGVDHENKFIFLTKVDYTTKEKDRKVNGPNGCKISVPLKPECNKSWTLTYDVEKNQWVGFEWFTPFLYGWNRFNMYSFNKTGMWRHSAKGVFQEFYGTLYPTVIEIVVNDKNYRDDFDYESTIIDTEAYEWKGCDYLRSPKITFDKLVAYNSHQNTGEIQLLNNNDDLNLIDLSRGFDNAVQLEWKGRRFGFSRIIDKLVNELDMQFTCDCEIGPRKLKLSNFSNKEKNYNWNDNHIVYRFYFSQHKDVKLFLKGIYTQVDVEIDQSDR